MKTLLVCCICLAFLSPATPALTAAPEPKVKPIELRLALMIPPTHARWTLCMEPWIKMVEERTGGKIKIVPYFAETLAKSAEVYQATVRGISDMGEMVLEVVPGRFPLGDFSLLPGVPYPNNATASRMYWHFYDTVPEFKAQFSDSKVILLFAQSRNVVMSKKPVQSLEDLKGKKYYAGGPAGVLVVKALGATPVTMSMADVYLSVDKGVLDGVVSNVSLLTSRKFAELMKYVVLGTSLGAASYVVNMNPDTWKKLPPDVQKVFDELGGKWGAEFFGKGMDTEDERAMEESKAKYKCDFFQLPQAEVAKWNKALDPVQEQWIKGIEAKGLPARKMFEEYRRFISAAK